MDKRRYSGSKTPLYVRDNIHVSLLAKAYVKFVNEFVNGNNECVKLNPSGYIESQGAFTKRFSSELSKRLNIRCEFELKEQTSFSEPLIRINTRSCR